MTSFAPSFLRRRPLGLLLIGCLVFSFTAGRLGADPSSNRAPKASSESPSPIIFDGWRRTANGWEQLPFEDVRPSINDWIANQKKEEATNPLTQPLQQLGQVHPISIAAAEVALACLIGLIASDRRPRGTERPQQTAFHAVS